ncbi:MAG TPA: hypothetical protein VM406_06170 [Noviherbaspirillum sp.]|nr:hypothetical protein [Noviherbaspirillum sp.]
MRIANWMAGGMLAMAAWTAHAGELRRFDADSMQSLVAVQQGKPFVLVLWSLDCAYCEQSLKTLADEQKRRKDLRVVTLSTDSLDDPDVQAAMQAKLRRTGVKSVAWAFGSAPPEQLRYAVDPKWHGEMPRSYWFTGEGAPKAYSGLISREIIGRMRGK